jgi:ABC-type spermidine/putrescine transport system permease subunit II
VSGAVAVVVSYSAAAALFGTWVAIMMRRARRRARELSRLEGP